MDACSPLREYAWLVDAVRRHQAEMNNLEAAVDAAIDEMPDDFMIKQFLVGNRAEVKASAHSKPPTVLTNSRRTKSIRRAA